MTRAPAPIRESDHEETHLGFRLVGCPPYLGPDRVRQGGAPGPALGPPGLDSGNPRSIPPALYHRTGANAEHGPYGYATGNGVANRIANGLADAGYRALPPAGDHHPNLYAMAHFAAPYFHGHLDAIGDPQRDAHPHPGFGYHPL